MALTAQLHSVTCTFALDTGATSVSGVIALVDDVFGVVGTRPIEPLAPAVAAGVRAAAIALLPATESALGVPLTLPPVVAPPEGSA